MHDATGYELFDHTADIGVRARAPERSGLLRACTAGLYEVIGQLVPTGETVPHAIELIGESDALLLRDYLAELLHLFETEGSMLTDLQVHEFSESHLAVSGALRRIDDEQSSLEREVKAITYHELDVRVVADGFEATFIVDI